MTSTQEAVAGAIERVLGARQRHEACIRLRPGPERTSFRGFCLAPKLRIYVSSANGSFAFHDDRDQLTESERDQIEVVEAEFLARTPESLAQLPFTSNPRVDCPSECKGEMLFILGEDNKRRTAVDYVAFLDDDIDVSASDLLKGATAAAQRNCSLFQLQLSHDSYAVWPRLKERIVPNAPISSEFPEWWTDIDFVEIMAPVIAQVELDRGLLDVLAPFKSGFGWDFYLLPVLADLYDDFRLGLFRGACMRHIRPVQTGNETPFSHGLTALQEEELLRAGLLQCLLMDGPLPDRAIFLKRLCEVLTSNDARLHAIAGGLFSVRKELESREREVDCLILQSRAQLEVVQQHRHQQEALLQHVHDLELQQLEAKRALDRCRCLVTSSRRDVAAIKRSLTWRLGRLVLCPLVRTTHLLRKVCLRLNFQQYRRVLTKHHVGDCVEPTKEC